MGKLLALKNVVKNHPTTKITKVLNERREVILLCRNLTNHRKLLPASLHVM
jgi:hypothetical protein